jgi:hypothetical protein
MKNLLAIGITGTLFYLGFRAFGLNRFNVYSVVRTLNPRITKVTLTGISLATDISIDNPTNTNLKVSNPVVTITTGGRYAASSVPTTETFTIAPQTRSALGTIEVEVPWSSLTPYIANLVSRIPSLIGKTNQSPAALDLPMEYYYTVYVNDLFYQSSPEKIA